MPNWCQNNLKIEGKKEDLEDFISKSKDGKFTLEAYYPYETEDGEWDYDWCAENWGTKWDVNTEIGMVLVLDSSPISPGEIDKTTELLEINGEITLKFDTAWGPCCEGIAKIAENYPNLTFKHTYFEAGHWFGGNYTYEDGKVTECIDIPPEHLTEDLVRDLGLDSYYY